MDNKQSSLKDIKLVICDVDGVLTDGGMYYGPRDIELKKFSVYDGAGVLFLRYADIPLVIMTQEDNEILRKRFKKLKIEDYRLGIKDKKKELAFIGDFINDFSIMKSVGLAACPLNACDEIKSISNRTIEEKGGNGVLWIFVKQLLKEKGLYEKAFKKYLEAN